eukprot:snap_masked-scaffold_23-processed-gene-1.24-mRNA-1 protein AED:0.08 eAED:0.08 QI:0/0/0/1/1/1/2/0/341
MSLNIENKTKLKTINDVKYISFNQDKTCFAYSTNNGFESYEITPFKSQYKQNFGSEGIRIIELCYSSSIIALVGGGINPKYPENKVMLYDNKISSVIGEISFSSKVTGVKLRKDLIIVSLENNIFFYDFKKLKLIETKKTAENKKGIFDLCLSPKVQIICFPGLQIGSIEINFIDIQKQTLITAHDSKISNLVISSSLKGTIIRIFDTSSGNILKQFRRGIDKANIYSLCLSFDNKYLCCTSNKGTIHIFNMNTKIKQTSKIKHILPKSFEYEKSFIKYKLVSNDEENENLQNICCFSREVEKYQLYIISVHTKTNICKFYKLSLEENKIDTNKFFKFYPQ